MKNLQAFIIGLFAVLTIGTASANAATWTVTKSANSNDGACNADCSLREAVAAADSGDTVVFNLSVLGQTITLGGEEIVITKRITIDGFLNDPNVAFISGSNTSRIFYLQAGSGLTLKNATLVQGNGKSSVNAPGNSEGGAIYAVNSSLSLERVAIRGNTAKFSGAVVLFDGTHHFVNSSFTGNTAETNTALSIRNGATVYMSNTTISNNHYFVGVGNTSGGGAILLQSANLFVRNSTIANNSANRGGGINCATGNNNSTLDIGNTIVAQNTAVESGQDIYRIPSCTITSRGGNLIGNLDTIPDNTFNQPNDIYGVNPLLAPMNASLDGFPVNTHPLQAGSPARNGGINVNAVDPLTNQDLTTDARGAGFPRIAAGTVDIGAFEDQSGNTSLIVSKKTNSNDLVCDTDCSLREAVHQAGLNFGTDTITFAPNVIGTLEMGGSEIEIKNQNVNIVGYPNLKAETLVISGGNTNLIFFLINATANISGLTLANGNGGYGGAILMSDNCHLTLDKVIVRNNHADRAGAIYMGPGGTARITNSTINNNSANTVLALEVPNGATLNMANTTVSANFDANGGTGAGAMFVIGTANIRNSTVAFNRTTGTGGGIFSIGTLNIGNSIVANNIAATSPDIHNEFGTITSVGGNLVQNTNGFPAGTFSQTNDQTGVDAQLVSLADNGGNVTTLALSPNSPAINTGVNSIAVDTTSNAPLTTDARGAGFARIVSGAVDKGAFESLVTTAATVSISGRVNANGRGLVGANVFFVDTYGKTHYAQSDASGFYKFDEVQVGETYVFSVISKKYTFEPKVVNVTEEIADLNFTLKR